MNPPSCVRPWRNWKNRGPATRIRIPQFRRCCRESKPWRGSEVESTDDSTSARGKPDATFVTTQWTRVLQARGDSPEARAALSDLCAAYYAPVFAFVRRNAPDEETARDLSQEFFTRLLERQGIHTVEPGYGRFRSYLLGAVKHFLADMRQRAHRLKRGAGQSQESIESGTDTSPGLQIPDANSPDPEREFDRKWALTLLDRALSALTDA